MRMTVPVREKDGNRVSVRAIPNDRDAVHLAALGPIVVRGVMLNGAVVPERDAVLFPLEATLVFGCERIPLGSIPMGNHRTFMLDFDRPSQTIETYAASPVRHF